MSTVAAPVAATRPASARPRRPLGKAAAGTLLRRILPAEERKPLEVAAFGSSV